MTPVQRLQQLKRERELRSYALIGALRAFLKADPMAQIHTEVLQGFLDAWDESDTALMEFIKSPLWHNYGRELREANHDYQS